MRIAILGSTSEIAKDLIISFSSENKHDLTLFSRQSDLVISWMRGLNINKEYLTRDLSEFNNHDKFDTIINFIGAGDPAKIARLGRSIMDITYKFDQLVLEYLNKHSRCRYIFISSGASYGGSFDNPVDENSKAIVNSNHLQSYDWYSIAKLYAESRHRAFSNFNIVDIRIFNYFSHTQDMEKRFLISDIIRSVKSNSVLITGPDDIVRDYIGRHDFYRLIDSIISYSYVNDVVDCYTMAPVSKMTLLNKVRDKFGLVYEISHAPIGVNATGSKMNYYSKNFKAKIYGYKPTKGSLENIIDETQIFLST